MGNEAYANVIENIRTKNENTIAVVIPPLPAAELIGANGRVAPTAGQRNIENSPTLRSEGVIQANTNRAKPLDIALKRSPTGASTPKVEGLQNHSSSSSSSSSG